MLDAGNSRIDLMKSVITLTRKSEEVNSKKVTYIRIKSTKLIEKYLVGTIFPEQENLHMNNSQNVGLKELKIARKQHPIRDSLHFIL